MKYLSKCIFLAIIFCAFHISGCGMAGETAGQPEAEKTAEENTMYDVVPPQTAGLQSESAKDGRIDFAALKKENPDIFAWIHVPDTAIDYPVLQSGEADDFYESHNAYGQADDFGALYIEMANMQNLCDFNTVIHGKSGEDDRFPFAEASRFLNPAFFAEHEDIYLYLDGNVLTYKIFAAYERDNTSLIRTYDFTYFAGCQQFLNEIYGSRDLAMQLREGWEGLTPYHFLLTLTAHKETDAEKQLVIVAVLTKDAAGTVERMVAE